MAGPLDDLLPIRVLQIDGVDQPYAPRLNFADGFTATFAEGATAATNSLRIESNATVADRSGTVSLLATQAWTDIGLPIALATETTAHYEVALHVSWPAHTIGEASPVAAGSVSRTVRVAVTRNATTGVVVVAEDVTAAVPWDAGRALVRIVGDGASGWQIEAERDTDESNESVAATITATVRTLTSADWDDASTPTILDPLADRVAALEEPACEELTADGVLAYGIQVLSGAGDQYTLPALSAAVGQCKAVVLVNETGLDLTITSDGTDPIVLDDLSTDTSVTVPASQRCVTFLDVGGDRWSPAIGLVAA